MSKMKYHKAKPLAWFLWTALFACLTATLIERGGHPLLLAIDLLFLAASGGTLACENLKWRAERGEEKVGW